MSLQSALLAQEVPAHLGRKPGEAFRLTCIAEIVIDVDIAPGDVSIPGYLILLAYGGVGPVTSAGHHTSLLPHHDAINSPPASTSGSVRSMPNRMAHTTPRPPDPGYSWIGRQSCSKQNPHPATSTG